jgi:sortase A
MTLVRSPLPGAKSAPGKEKPLPRWATAPRPEPRPTGPGHAAAQVCGSAVIILAVSLLGFAAWLALLSRLPYDRAQHDIYADFRVELAKGIAPTGPTQPTAPRKLLSPGTAVAVLTIPAIGLKAVVLEGTSAGVLESGPGHWRVTPLPGQAGICEIMGRRATYGAPFARISSLSPGAIIEVTTGQGRARYRVIDVRRAGNPNPPVYPGQGRLVLATADGPPFTPSGVLRVDARLLSKPFPAPPMVVSTADLSPGEYVLGSDPLAWIPLFLWGQALVIVACVLSWLRLRWGRWQTWIVAVPVLGFLGVIVAEQVTRLLPNLL